MAEIVVKKGNNGRLHFTAIGEGQNGFKLLRGTCAFNGTDASGTLAVPGLSRVDQVELTLLDTPASPVEMITIPLGTISATMVQKFRIPHAGTITNVAIGTNNTITAHADNHWTFRLINKSQANLAIITADSSNSTDADAVPAGFTIANDFPHALFRAAAPADAVNQFDVLEFTATKAAAATTMTAAYLELLVNIGGTDEVPFVQANADGTIPITGGKITIQRTGNVKTSGLKFSALVYGR